MARPRYPDAKLHKQTREDMKQQDLTKAATDAAIAALKPIVQANPNKLLVNLAMHEMESMAVAAITAYDKRRAELELMDDLNDDISDIGIA